MTLSDVLLWAGNNTIHFSNIVRGYYDTDQYDGDGAAHKVLK